MSGNIAVYVAWFLEKSQNKPYYNYIYWSLKGSTDSRYSKVFRLIVGEWSEVKKIFFLNTEIHC